MLVNVNIKEFSGIETFPYDDDNFVEMGFKWTVTPEARFREYIVQGKLNGEWFAEHFFTDDSKAMAYEYYDEKVKEVLTSDD